MASVKGSDAREIEVTESHDLIHWKNVGLIRVQEAYEKNLNIMDMTAFTLCMENKLPIIVFDMNKKGSLLKIARGEEAGTLIS